MSTNAPHTPGEFGEPPARTAATGVSRGPAYYLWRGVKALASLQLTVALFGLGILLIFFGTLAQLDYGIWTVVDKYFWSWTVDVPLNLFSKFLAVFWKEQFEHSSWKGSFPFPAGKLLGALMLVNLLSAHAIRFRLTWKRAGVFFIHGGLILLFAGEFITREFAVEQQMTINEGESADFTHDTRNVELAFIDRSDPKHDAVSSIPQKTLKTAKGRIAHPDLPVDVEVVEYMTNADLQVAGQARVKNPADSGAIGKFAVAVKKAEGSGVAQDAPPDMAAVYVKLFKKGTDQALGTYLASQELGFGFKLDEIDVDGKPVALTLRYKRYYKPYRVHLDKFSFDRYTGTEKPKNYSSDVRVFVPGDPNPVRQVRIAMNEPLRYGGETFYQSSFDKRTEKTTVLQVVKNPGWLNLWLFEASVDYIACAVVSFGLLLHFTIYLVQFLRRGATPAVVETPAVSGVVETSPAGMSAPIFGLWARVASAIGPKYFPWTVLGLLALYLLSVAGRMSPPKDPVDLDVFGRMVVMEGGRAKPLDTAARAHLRMLSGREEITHDGKKIPAVQWYLESLASGGRPGTKPLWDYKFIRIDNEAVLQDLKLETRDGLRYSLNELLATAGERGAARIDIIRQRAEAAGRKIAAQQKPDVNDNKFRELADRIGQFIELSVGGNGRDAPGSKPFGPLLLPAQNGQEWAALGQFRERAGGDAALAAMLEAKTRLEASKKLDNLTRDDEQALAKIVMGVDLEKADPKKRAETVKESIEVLRINPAGIAKPQRLEWLRATNTLLTDADRAAVADTLQKSMDAELAKRPAAAAWEKLLSAYRDKRPNDFSTAVADYRAQTADIPDVNVPNNFLERIVYTPFNAIGRNTTEIVYNRFAPFYLCSGLYAIILVLTLVGFTQQAAGRPNWAVALRRAAGYALLLTFAVHTLALLARMYLMERAGVFVTNLYSSAIFIGWGGVLLGLAIEAVFKLGVGNLLATVLGLATCIVGHNLAIDDPLEMMQAVLDTNFWLATHVTTITLGYTATFVAGFLGTLYVVQMLAAVVRDSFQSTGEPTVGELLAFGVAATGSVAVPLFLLWFATNALEKFEVLPGFLLWTMFLVLFVVGVLYAIGLMLMKVGVETTDAQGKPLPGHLPGLAKPLAAMALTPERGKVFGQMVYGVVCFATLLSFVGTVLGGIWADQSWGRFWGWDPKENGAVLIVLWNSLILHARWCGLVKDRGMAVLAIFGNVITAWSWFGTNQLGIGLHAYGFDSRLADGCFNFWISQMLILGLGLVPSRFWKGAARSAVVLTARTPAAPAPSATDAPTPLPVATATPVAPAPVAAAPHTNGNGNGHHSKRDKKKPGKRR